MANNFRTFTIIYTIIAILLHIAFIIYTFMNRKIECVDRLDPLSEEFELFIVWAIFYFPLIILCLFYTLLFRMCRSFICSCHECCGNDKNGKGATKCKIRFEGIFGNPLIFAVIYILWGILEWTSFGTTCSVEIEYGFLADLIIASISLILLCIYYFKSVQHRFNEKRNENIAKKYNNRQRENKKIAAYNDPNAEDAHNQNPELNEGSAQPQRRWSAQHIPQNNKNGFEVQFNYAHSAHNIPAYNGDRRHSYNPKQVGSYSPNNGGPVYAASAQGIAPYNPQDNVRRHSSFQPNQYQNNDNPLMESQNAAHHTNNASASIEISIDFDGDDDMDLISSGHVTRGPSISFPAEFKGHARRVSSGILTILKKIEAEPECSICMDDLLKGHEMGQLECGHTFHKKCIVDWLKTSPLCPMCRAEMKK